MEDGFAYSEELSALTDMALGVWCVSSLSPPRVERRDQKNYRSEDDV